MVKNRNFLLKTAGLMLVLMLVGCSSPNQSTEKESVKNSSQNSDDNKDSSTEHFQEDLSNDSQSFTLAREKNGDYYSVSEIFSSIPNDPNISIQPNSGFDNCFFFQTLDCSSGLFPTVDLYGWNCETEELKLISSRNPDLGIRVWDFLVKNEKLYESRVRIENNRLINEIFCDNKPIFSTTISSLSGAVVFSVIDDELYGLVEKVESDYSSLELLMVTDRGYKTIWERKTAIDSSSLKLLKGNEMQENVKRISFEYLDDSVMKLVFFDGKELKEVPTDIRAHQIVPLETGTVVCELYNAPGDRTFKSTYYWFQQDTEEPEVMSAINAPAQPGGFGAEDDLSYLSSGSSEGVFRAAITKDSLIYEKINDIPSGKYNFYKLNQDYDLIIVRNPVNYNGVSRLKYSAYHPS
ncbi:hypothetical protein IM774_02925 [Erysipelotrichaceae bacterium RD49]|nr:hypothetical protein [Erysipelotrichaceae bacterium RD49]